MRFFRTTRSLRAILIIFALSTIIPATVAVGALVAWSAVGTRKAQEEQLLATARAVSAAVDLRLSELSTSALALATSEPLLRGDWPTTRKRFERLNLGHDVSLQVTDTRGRQLLATAGQNGPATSLQRSAGGLAALRTGRPQISDLATDRLTGAPVLTVDRAVAAASADRVVSIVIRADGLSRLLGSQPLPEGAMATLVDGRKRVVARTMDQARFVGVRAAPDLIAAMMTRSSGVASSRSLDGRPKILAYVRSEATGLTTVVALPRESFTFPILRNILGFTAVAASMLLIGLGGALFSGRLIARELKLLKADAIALGAGEKVPTRIGPIDLIDTVHTAMSDAGDELERRQDRQTLMINELNHRVKNTLATVQGLAAQTFRGNDPAAANKFEKRLQALAGAHDLLTQTNWGPVDIRSVVARCGEFPGARIATAGPSLMMPAQAAFGLCLCLHELTTNSLKYGALSVETGDVSLDWSVEDATGLLTLVWREAGGPEVRQPERPGFGTRLIDRLAATELGGSVERDYAASGLVVTGRFQLADHDRWKTAFE